MSSRQSHAAAHRPLLPSTLVLTPGTASPELGSLIRAHADPTFQAQSLTILLQVMAMFLALVTLSVKLFPIAPGLTILAAAFLLMWRTLEIVPRSIDFFVFSLDYAAAYVAGLGDRAMIEGEFQRFLAWERGWRTMRQAVWAAGLLLIGLAAWRGSGLGRPVGALLMLNGIRVAALLAASLAGAALPLGRGLFVVVNIACFRLLAAWLWLSPATEASHYSADPYRAIP